MLRHEEILQHPSGSLGSHIRLLRKSYFSRLRRSWITFQFLGDFLLTEVCSYLLNLTIGTPPRHSQLIVDSASSTTVFLSLDSKICQIPNFGCENFTDYSVNESTSAHLNSQAFFNLTYASESIRVNECTESIGFGNIKLLNTTVGVVDTLLETSNGPAFPTGVLGLGPVEAQDGTGLSKSTPSFLQSLKNAGYIRSKAYSISLDSLSISPFVSFSD